MKHDKCGADAGCRYDLFDWLAMIVAILMMFTIFLIPISLIIMLLVDIKHRLGTSK